MCHIYLNLAVCDGDLTFCGSVWLYAADIHCCDLERDWDDTRSWDGKRWHNPRDEWDHYRCPNAVMTMPAFEGTFDDLCIGPCQDCQASMSQDDEEDLSAAEEEDDNFSMSFNGEDDEDDFVLPADYGVSSSDPSNYSHDEGFAHYDDHDDDEDDDDWSNISL